MPTAQAADGELNWAQRFGSAIGNDQGRDFAVDADGNVFITGIFGGTVDFDPSATINSLASNSNSLDVFVAKYNSAGAYVWARSFGSNVIDEALSIDVDSLGNVYSTGFFRNSADFDPGAGMATLTVAGTEDVFIWKLDSNGNFVWARQLGGSSSETGWGLRLDSNDNVVTVGTFAGTCDFDPRGSTSNLTSAGAADAFISKVSSSGAFVSAQRVGGTLGEVATSVAVDASNNVYVNGEFSSTNGDFDPGVGTFPLTNGGDRDVFTLKLESDGDLAWARAVGGTGADVGAGIELGDDGTIHISGYFNGTVDFDPSAAISNLVAPGLSGYVSKLDNNGAFIWAGMLGGTAIGMTVDPYGNLYTTGQFSGTADFDPGEGTVNRTSAGGGDVFVVKLNKNGHLDWARSMGGTGHDLGFGLRVGSTGFVYITGYFQGTADFDPNAGVVSLSSAGSFDGFFLSLSTPPDTTAPNVASIVPTTTGPTNADDISFTVTFDEEVQNFNDAADLVVTHTGTSSTGATFFGSGKTYTVTVNNIAGDGSFTMAVNTSSDVEDLAENALASTVTSAAVNMVNNAPVVSIGTADDTVVNSSDTVTFPITVTGASAVSLDSGDVTVNHSGTSGGSVSVLNGTTNAPSVEVTGVTGNGSYTITLAQGVATDTGNPSAAAGPSGAVTVDNQVPTLAIGAPTGTPLSSSGTATYPLTITGADTIDLQIADVSIQHAGTANGTIVVLNGATVAPSVQVSGLTGNGTATITIANLVATDAAGNSNEQTGPSSPVTVDNTAPTVSIGSPSDTSVNNAQTVSFTITVTGADDTELLAGDVTVNHSGTAGGTVNVVNPTSAAPTVEVSGVTGNGTYTISINPGIATDNVSNASLAAGPSSAVTVDNTAPVVTVDALATSDPNPALTGTVTDANGVAGVEVVVDGQNYTASVSPGQWSVVVTSPLDDGTYNVTASATDLVGNAGADNTTNELVVAASGPGVPVRWQGAALLLSVAGAILLRRTRRHRV